MPTRGIRLQHDPGLGRQLRAEICRRTRHGRCNQRDRAHHSTDHRQQPPFFLVQRRFSNPIAVFRSACQISRTEIGAALLILGTLRPRRTFADQADSIASTGEGFRTGRESTEAIPLFDVQPCNQLHQLRHRPGAHFFHHVGAVVLDRLRADGEVPGDCLVRVTSDDQVQYLAFA